MNSAEKTKGDLSELRFLLKIAELGGVISKPYGDNAHYDFVVDFNDSLKRVQVKSTTFKNKHNKDSETEQGTYQVIAAKGSKSKIPYSKKDIDFIAAYIIPEDCWYILPVEAMNNHVKLRFSPHVLDSKAKYEAYKSRWDLLVN